MDDIAGYTNAEVDYGQALRVVYQKGYKGKPDIAVWSLQYSDYGF